MKKSLEAIYKLTFSRNDIQDVGEVKVDSTLQP